MESSNILTKVHKGGKISKVCCSISDTHYQYHNLFLMTIFGRETILSVKYIFTETAVINSDDRSNTKESNFTVIVKNGVGIQIAELNDMLSLAVMIPPGVSDKFRIFWSKEYHFLRRSYHLKLSKYWKSGIQTQTQRKTCPCSSFSKFVSNGLLGSWNNKSIDDLSAANGSSPMNAEPKTLFEQFVITCTYIWYIPKRQSEINGSLT